MNPARNVAPGILNGLELASTGLEARATAVCASHLAMLGARPSLDITGDAVASGRLALRGNGLDVTCAIDWLPATPGTEAVVQATSGLMAVHGRDRGVPRRLGLSVASVAAGIVATQGVLAALIAQHRGLPTAVVETSVLRAALLFVSHHLAIATSGGEFPYQAGGSAGPPFRTADGHWVEIEVLSGDDWVAFWRRLGVGQADVDGSWLPFVYRYLAGRCALPAALQEATRRHTLAGLRQLAEASGVALSPVRTCSGRPTQAPWTIRPHAVPAQPSTASVEPVLGGPLNGLRVVEVTSRLQGPLAGLLLHQLGADVVKVEPPGGDPGRISPPLADGTGAAYLAYNRGKRVVEIDYKCPSGQATLIDLAADADVFLHNWRPGRAESLGLDATDAARRNPAIVYAYASGWGGADDAPSPIAGDFIVQAHAGCGKGLNPPDELPFPSRVTLVDVTGGLTSCEGILAGLYLRERTGRGCRVDTSLLTGALALQVPTPSRWGVLDRPLRTLDGYLVVSVDDTGTRHRLCDACGVSPAVPDELIGARLQERPAADWEPVLRAARIPAAKVCTDLADVPNDPRLAGLLERANNACWVPGAPWRFSP